MPTDVGDPKSVGELFARTKAAFGRLDVLFNNAGVGAPAVPLEDISFAKWQEVVAANLTGPFLCARAAIPALRRRGGGSIVNIGSIEGLWAEAGLAAYCASKGGLLALTRSIAVDFGKDGIRCTCVCPTCVPGEPCPPCDCGATGGGGSAPGSGG